MSRPANTAIEVDARMWAMSGIGRYLRSIVGHWPRGFGRLRLPSGITPPDGHASTVDDAPIYGWREQISRCAPETEVVWTPHYNFPALHPGIQVVTVHDLAHLALPEVFGRTAKRAYAWLYFRWLYLWSDCTIFISNFTRNEFRREIGALPRSVVIPNGVDRFWFDRARSRNPGGRPGPRRVLIVGNNKPHKNLARLLHALREDGETGRVEVRVVGQLSGFRTGGAILAGGGWLVPLGQLSDDDLKREYAAADCFVMPSLYEGFGLPVLEAMAAGCPVVLSRIGAFREIVAPAKGRVAEFFCPHDVSDMKAAIWRTLSLSAQERSARMEAALELAGQYSWEKAAAATRSVLEVAVKAARGVVV